MCCGQGRPVPNQIWKIRMKTQDSFLRLPAVLSLIPVSRATWYEGMKSGRFPAPVKLGARASAWRRSDIDRLIETLSQGQPEK